jgi:hypothetical protein
MRRGSSGSARACDGGRRCGGGHQREERGEGQSCAHVSAPRTSGPLAAARPRGPRLSGRSGDAEEACENRRVHPCTIPATRTLGAHRVRDVSRDGSGPGDSMSPSGRRSPDSAGGRRASHSRAPPSHLPRAERGRRRRRSAALPVRVALSLLRARDRAAPARGPSPRNGILPPPSQPLRQGEDFFVRRSRTCQRALGAGRVLAGSPPSAGRRPLAVADPAGSPPPWRDRVARAPRSDGAVGVAGPAWVPPARAAGRAR